MAAPSYSLTLSATTGECWVDVDQHRDGRGALHDDSASGQSHAIAATGPVTVIAGAPAAFAATVNGAPVALPSGNQAPFTLHFQTARRRLTADRLAPAVDRATASTQDVEQEGVDRAPLPSRRRSGPTARRGRRRARS